MSVKLITGLVRFSYVNVWQPKEDDNGNTKYSVSLLFPKKNKNAVNAVKHAIREAADEAKQAGTFGKKDPKKMKAFKWALRDGDEEREDDPNYAGMYFMNVWCKEQPLIGDADKQEILDEDEFYSGCWGRASIMLSGFEKDGNMGISAYLHSVQKLRDGDRLSGRDSLENDFADDVDDDEFDVVGDFVGYDDDEDEDDDGIF